MLLPLILQAGGQETVLRVYMSSPIGGVFADITPDLILQHRQVRFRQLHMAFCRGCEVMQTIDSKCSAPADRLDVDLYLFWFAALPLARQRRDCAPLRQYCSLPSRIDLLQSTNGTAWLLQGGESEVRFWVKAQRQPNMEAAVQQNPKQRLRTDSMGSNASSDKGAEPAEPGMDHEVQLSVSCRETAAAAAATAPGAMRRMLKCASDRLTRRAQAVPDTRTGCQAHSACGRLRQQLADLHVRVAQWSTATLAC